MLNAYEIAKYLRACADKGGLSIVWEDEAQPRTDGINVYLPKLGLYTTPEQAREMIHFVNHESSHIRFSQFKNLDKIIEFDHKHPIAGLLFSMWEDNRIEHLNDREYMGDREITEEFHENHFVAGAKKVAELDDEKIKNVLMTSYGLWSTALEDMYPGAKARTDEIISLMTDEAKEFYQKALANEDLIELIAKSTYNPDPKTGTGQSGEIVMKLWEEVFEMPPPPPPKPDSGDGNESEGEGEGKGKGKGKAKAGKGKPGDEEEGQSLDEYLDPKWLEKHAKEIEAIAETHEAHAEGRAVEQGQNWKTAAPIQSYRVPYNQSPPENFDYINYDTGERQGSFAHKTLTPTANGYLHSQLDHVKAENLANILRKRLQIRARGKTYFGQKRGKLHTANVHRVVMKDAPGYNERLFKRKLVSNILDTAVSVLMDASGSMHGSKMQHALASGLLLSEAIGNVLHIPVELAAFSDRRYRRDAGPQHVVFRDFNDKLLSREKLIDRYSIVEEEMMCSNADGESIFFAHDRIMKRPEKRRLLIVLSDGQPAGGRGDISTYTRDIIKDIQDNSPIEIVGIGIETDHVKYYYKDYRVIRDTDELEKCILDLLDQKMR